MHENILLKAWARFYEAALLEFDPHKRIKRIAVADNSIKERLHELRFGGHRKERQSIESAQNVLRFLRADGPIGGHQKEILTDEASVTRPGAIDEIIPSVGRAEPDKAQLNG